ncbi:MAG: amidohydrolase family protein [Actinobacteria bacterium]|nr:amidohydrolase family protein [Actinomycetota bacterium]
MVGPDDFIDTHVHFWDHSVEGLHWPWLEAGFSHRNVAGTEQLDAPRYTTAEFRAESAGAGVAGMVHVQAVDGVADLARETEWLQGLADRSGLPSAIVGSCIVTAPDAVALLERHARFPRFVGVRDITAAKHLDATEAAPALDRLAAAGRSFEARRHHAQFDVLDEIAARWPDLTVVLSHACLPAERTESERAAWTEAARALARRPNVVCKISAVAGASDPNWTVASIRPWILGCIDTFGPDRCMFGTNWPIDRLHGTYLDVVAAYREVTADLSDSDRHAVLAGTASRVYAIADR